MNGARGRPASVGRPDGSRCTMVDQGSLGHGPKAEKARRWRRTGGRRRCGGVGAVHAVGSCDDASRTPHGSAAGRNRLRHQRVRQQCDANSFGDQEERHAPIPVGSVVWAVAITPDGKTAFVTNQGDNNVTPIDWHPRRPAPRSPSAPDHEAWRSLPTARPPLSRTATATQ